MYMTYVPGATDHIVTVSHTMLKAASTVHSIIICKAISPNGVHNYIDRLPLQQSDTQSIS